MNITPLIIEEIKFKNDIETVISSYVSLKRAGSNLNGLCPFHSEKTPSFTVFPSTQSFYCFGCGAGGDVISFIMRAENLDYLSAIRLLAQRSGITIPENTEDTYGIKTVGRQRILDMNKEAALYFHKCLFDNPGNEARNYLINKRKLSTAVINHFGLGYAPNSAGMLHDYLKSKGYTDEEMITGFLCGKNNKGYIFDYFRNRIIFPIIDVSGNVIAFGGRVMDDSKPKYLNTSDTPAFKKSKHLYALNFAKNYCSDMMILCEGYMDVIALHSAGFPFAVATLGTAITQEQARIFARYTKKIIISYDSDEAGQKAAKKAFEYLQEVGLDIRILKVTDSKDPDEFIKKFGKEKFQDLLVESKSRFEYESEKILNKYNINDTDQKVKAISDFCKLISTFYSKVVQEVYIQNVSVLFGIPEEVIRKDVKRIVDKRIKEEKNEQSNKIFRDSSGIGDRINPETSSNLKASKTEEAIIGIIVLKNDLIKFCMDNLSEDDFITSFNKRVYCSIVNVYKERGKFDVGYIGDKYSAEEISRITKMMINRQVLEDNNSEILSDFIKKLKTLKKKDDSVQSLEELFKAKK